MSLENKIEELTKAIEELTNVVKAQLVTNMATFNEVKAQQDKSKAEKVKVEDKPEPVDQDHVIPFDAVTREDLQTICSEIVRSDRAKKDAIREALAEYDAKTLTQVPDDKLAELKAALEALK